MTKAHTGTDLSSASTTQASLAGIRVSAILEIVMFLGVALAIDQIFLDGSRFRSAPEHPFWILVLLVTVQYGTNAGLLAALASSAALLAGGVPPQAITQDRFTWLFQIGLLPLLWFVSAVVLGELRMRQIRERATLSGQLAETAHRERVLSDGYKRLSDVKDVLETRIAGQLRTAVGMYEAARAIEKLDPAEVLLGVADLIRSVMNPEKFSVYLLRNGGLELAVEDGWAEEDGFPRRYGANTPIFQEIIGRQRVLTVANPDDALALAGAGIIGSPLVVPDTGRIIGMLKIEKLGFLDLTFSNVQTLKVLCQWIGAAYENAVRYQTARSESVVNTETELFAYGFLSRQLSFLTLLARRVGFDLTMIVVRLENPDSLTEEQRTLVPRAFSHAASQALRKTDMAFDYQRTGTEFAIVLPSAPVKHAHVVISKLAGALEEKLALEAPAARFSFGVHAVHELASAKEEHLELQSV
jgi:polysaccharide biosynthesis protein PelD